jgi:hypothetical protein
MGTRARRWEEPFPYRGGQVTVQRFTDGWRIGLGAREADGKTLVGAFEAMLKRPAGDPELGVVLAALARDRAKETSVRRASAP